MLLDERMLDGLGRLCDGADDVGIDVAPPSSGLQRIGARFFGTGYAPHRHDTYSLGITLSGVQKFTYRGARRASMPGQIIVLHPDEVHDGAAGTEDGLSYRMLYLEPALLHAALPQGAAYLPFVHEPVLNDPDFRQTLALLLNDLDSEVEALQRDAFIAATADALCRHSGLPAPRRTTLDMAALNRVRDHIRENAASFVSSDELETLCGLDRFSLARQFRALCGTSPHRYLTMRRLDLARSFIGAGLPLAQVAAASGFSDQSHLNRQFKKAFGMPPGAWSQLIGAKTGSR
ncbi:AraC family transcriptional regulator [Rhizobium sp. C4]|uniref:AraC family transcriptional regulator n=1 Tax=Rhizobium sp. C4 TaxID=1349800 RepID=UPI001E5221D5|nr:AraC family transcriptional regulator [Rhizobium sp. C4]MCD2174439.1 AraC family transcriptional regulator [Rhizobium sp. C4]